MSEEDKKIKEQGKQCRKNIYEEYKQKKKQHMKEHTKSQSNNLLKKIKEKIELKSVELEIVTNFIKDEVESFSNDVDADTNNGVNNDEEDKVTESR